MRMLFFSFLYMPQKVAQKSLYELFELFTGVNENKYGPEIRIEGETRKVILLRLSSINESFDNVIRSKTELGKLEADLQGMRSKKMSETQSQRPKAVITDEKFLLKETDYLITTRGEVRVINVKEALDNENMTNELVPTQHFICLRPRKNTIRLYQKEYLDIIIKQTADHLRNRSKEKYISQLKLKLKTGGKLEYQAFKEGEKLDICDKLDNKEIWEQDKLYTLTAVNLNNLKQNNIKFTVRNGIIEEILKSQFNIISIKELEEIEINIDEDETNRKTLVTKYKEMKVEFDAIKYRLKFFNESLQNTLFMKYDHDQSI